MWRNNALNMRLISGWTRPLVSRVASVLPTWNNFKAFQNRLREKKKINVWDVVECGAFPGDYSMLTNEINHWHKVKW